MERMSAAEFRRQFCKIGGKIDELEGRMVGKRGAKAGKRADLGLFVRSRYEANYARYLKFLQSKGEIQSWQYEPQDKIFDFPVKGLRNARYRPDFWIVNRNGQEECHEVKGWMDKDSKVKLKRMAKFFPDVKVVVIGTTEMKAIERTVASLIQGWEWPDT